MKIRQDFVTNSSSSSFVISRRFVSDDQLDKIENHSEYAKKHIPTIEWPEYSWSIEITNELVLGNTSMDNFDMYEFLDIIGIDVDRVRWNL